MLSTLLSGCGWYYSTVTIENRSSSKIEQILMVHEGKVSSHGFIEPGRAASFSRHFPGEADGRPARITFVMSGRQVEEELCYFTAGSPFEAKITVTDVNVEMRCY